MIQRATLLEGSLDDIELASVLQTVSVSRRAIGIELRDPTGNVFGTLVLKAGQIVSADAEGSSGIDGLRRLVSTRHRGRFCVYRAAGVDLQAHVGPVADVLANVLDGAPSAGSAPPPAAAASELNGKHAEPAAAPSGRRSLPPESASRSVPPESGSRSVPPEPALRSVPPEPASRSVPPESASRSLPPEPASRSVPPESAPRSLPPEPALRSLPPSGPRSLPPPARGAGSVAPEPRAAQPLLKGELRQFELRGLLETLSLSRGTLGLELFAADGARLGALCLKAGQVLSASCGHSTGEPAARELLKARAEGSFAVFRAHSEPLGEPLLSVRALLRAPARDESLLEVEDDDISEADAADVPVTQVAARPLGASRPPPLRSSPPPLPQAAGGASLGPVSSPPAAAAAPAAGQPAAPARPVTVPPTAVSPTSVPPTGATRSPGLHSVAPAAGEAPGSLRAPARRSVAPRPAPAVAAQTPVAPPEAPPPADLSPPVLARAGAESDAQEPRAAPSARPGEQAGRASVPKGDDQRPKSLRPRPDKPSAHSQPSAAPAPNAPALHAPGTDDAAITVRRPAARARPPIIAVTSPKGGAGRTTLTLNLAVSLARRGRRVLVVDADVSNVLPVFGAPPPTLKGVADVLQARAPLGEVLRETRVPGLTLLASGELSEETYRHFGWPALLASAAQQADLVLVDCAPAWYGATLSVLAAATHQLVVLGAEPAARALCTAYQARLAQRLLQAGKAPPALLGIVINMLEYQAQASVRSLEELSSSEFAQHVLDVPIPRSPAFMEASARGVPIVHVEQGPAPTVAWVFETLATAVLERLLLEQPVFAAAPLLA